MANDLQDRLFHFAENIIHLLKSLPDNPENKVIRYQLVRCATSAGANYEESQAGSSKADFINKVRIALREMRESNYWLRLLKATEKNIIPKNMDHLITESEELMRILGAIAQKARK
jgi:four helix bundle protein